MIEFYGEEKNLLLNREKIIGMSYTDKTFEIYLEGYQTIGLTDFLGSEYQDQDLDYIQETITKKYNLNSFVKDLVSVIDRRRGDTLDIRDYVRYKKDKEEDNELSDIEACKKKISKLERSLNQKDKIIGELTRGGLTVDGDKKNGALSLTDNKQGGLSFYKK